VYIKCIAVVSLKQISFVGNIVKSIWPNCLSAPESVTLQMW